MVKGVIFDMDGTMLIQNVFLPKDGFTQVKSWAWIFR